MEYSVYRNFFLQTQFLEKKYGILVDKISLTNSEHLCYAKAKAVTEAEKKKYRANKINL